MVRFKHPVETGYRIHQSLSWAPGATLSELLPYDPNNKHHLKLTDGLKEYKLLLLAAKQGLSCFRKGSLADLDSLVGENSCQIRATLLALVVSQQTVRVEPLLKKIDELLERVDLEREKQEAAQTHSYMTLGCFLDAENLHLEINHHELFLIASYVLTKVRVLLPPHPEKMIVRNESTDTKKVKEISSVGSSFARDLVKQLRHIVSVLSVNFVLDITKLLSLPSSIMEMVSDKYCLIHDKFGRLKCLPCFWYTFILLEYSLKMELPIVLVVSQLASDKNFEIVDRAVIYYQVRNGKYQEVSRDSFEEDAVVLVMFSSCCRKESEFQGFNAWKEETKKMLLTELILAYAASHRQYPDETKDVLVSDSDCDLYHFYKSKAAEWGCSLDNPTLFFLVHAYSDQIKNIHA